MTPVLVYLNSNPIKDTSNMQSHMSMLNLNMLIGRQKLFFIIIMNTIFFSVLLIYMIPEKFEEMHSLHKFRNLMASRQEYLRSACKSSGISAGPQKGWVISLPLSSLGIHGHSSFTRLGYCPVRKVSSTNFIIRSTIRDTHFAIN